MFLDHIIHVKIRSKPYRFYIRTVRGLVYRACDLVKKARFFSKQILPCKLFWYHTIAKTYILNLKLWVQHSALHSKQYTLWISSYGFDIQLCIRKHTSCISSCEFNIQLCIQNNTHFEYRAMGSTFSSAFENIHLEYRVVSSTFSSAFKIINTMNIELWVRHWALHSKTYILNIELISTFSSTFKIIHTLNFELWVRHSALHSKTYILNIELWVQHSALLSK